MIKIVAVAMMTALAVPMASAGPAERLERLDNRMDRAERNGAWEQGSRMDRIEDRIDRREDVIDRRENRRDEAVDLGPRDVFEDKLDRLEDRWDRRESLRDRRN